jgi:hypothetical protein
MSVSALRACSGLSLTIYVEGWVGCLLHIAPVHHRLVVFLAGLFETRRLSLGTRITSLETCASEVGVHQG